MDRFEQMRVFARVVDAGGFTSASAGAGMSRAAISKHILQLEERLGVRLLNRTTRRVSVTEAGRLFHEQCRRLLDDLALAERGAAKSAAGPEGELRMVAPTNFGLTFLGPAITEFLIKHPGIKINLSMNDRPIDPIESGYDLAIRVVTSAPLSSASLEVCKLTISRRILCASPDYLARRGVPGHPRDLAAHECLSYSYVDDPRVWRLRTGGREHAVAVSGRIITSAGQVLRAAAAAGLGIAYGPAVFFTDDMEAGRVVPVLPGCELPAAAIFSVYPISRYPQPKVAAFNAFMQKFFEGKFA